MKIKATSWIASGVILTSVFVSLGNNGCGDDSDSSNTISSRIGRKGEACQSTIDCAPGLACVQTGSGSGTCVVGTFNVAATNKECAITECSVAKDCCADPPSFCADEKAQCEVPNPPSFCLQYQQLCVCDETRRSCEAGKCVVTCADDAGCNAGSTTSKLKCIGGKCGQCSGDADCKDIGGTSASDTYTCVNAVCKPPCQGDGDCSGFDRCLNGKCIDGGCQSTRECIASTRNVEATCGTDGKCIIPCQTDLECGNPKGYNFFSCIQNQCVYTGCDTDKDCRLYLCGSRDTTTSSTSSSGSSSGSIGNCTTSKEHIVCRPKATPGALTPP